MHEPGGGAGPAALTLVLVTNCARLRSPGAPIRPATAPSLTRGSGAAAEPLELTEQRVADDGQPGGCARGRGTQAGDRTRTVTVLVATSDSRTHGDSAPRRERQHAGRPLGSPTAVGVSSGTRLSRRRNACILGGLRSADGRAPARSAEGEGRIWTRGRRDFRQHPASRGLRQPHAAMEIAPR